MSFNGSGTFVINSAGQPVVANTVISATVFNALTSDLATGLSTCITKDGQTTITANIPFGNNKITGLASGTAATDAANLGQVQSTAAKLITVTGTDTITGTMTPALTAYASGQLFYFIANGTNTGAMTINVDGLGAKSITRDGSTALSAGDVISGEMVVICYDGTRFQMINAANSFGNATITGTLTLSGGTANGVLYLNGSKAATSGSAITFDGTNFATTGTASATKLIPTGGAATGNGMYLPAANTLAFSNNGSETMRLDSSGNLGLGVTPGTWNSAFKAMQIGSSGSLSDAGSGNFLLASNYRNDGSNAVYIASGYATIYQQFNGAHTWYNAPSWNGTGSNIASFTQAMTLDASGNLLVGGTSTAQLDGAFGQIIGSSTKSSAGIALETQYGAYMLYTDSADALIFWDSGANTERARIDSSGNLGIGTSSPSFASGMGIAVYNSTVGGAARIALKNGSTGDASGDGFQLAASGVDAYVENRENGILAFTTNNTERGRFTAGGYFKASNTGTYQGSTLAYHELRTDAADYSTIVGNTNASPYGAYILFGSADPNNSTNLFLLCNGWNGSSLATRATIRSNGGLANYQSNNVDLSDARTKKDIAPAASMWGKIGALEIVTYKYNDQTHDDVNVGVIAQQVESVEPVWVDADGFGETLEGEEPLKTVYTKDITFAAIKALQEAMTRIEQLEAKVAALESK